MRNATSLSFKKTLFTTVAILNTFITSFISKSNKITTFRDFRRIYFHFIFSIFHIILFYFPSRVFYFNLSSWELTNEVENSKFVGLCRCWSKKNKIKIEYSRIPSECGWKRLVAVTRCSWSLLNAGNIIGLSTRNKYACK